MQQSSEQKNSQGKVEAVLFASGRSMDEQAIMELTALKPKQTLQALNDLKRAYEERAGALFVWNEGTKWKINVREEHSEIIKNLAAETELSRPVMATLALIAYRSPVLQSEIIKSRGEGAYAHISELVEKEFVTKEKMGISFKLKIAEKFYNYFDVEGDKDIKEAFSEVKPKEIGQLGSLPVVEAKTDDEAELEVLRGQTRIEIYDIKQQRENDKDFLNEFDGRLGTVSENINYAEKELREQKDKYAEREEEQEDGEHDEETAVQTARQIDYEANEATISEEEPPANKHDETEQILAEVNKEITALTGKDDEQSEKDAK